MRIHINQASCTGSAYEADLALYGGPPFVLNDFRTHWSEPHQLYTWWKNNIERKSKYLSLERDAEYDGTEQFKACRYAYANT